MKMEYTVRVVETTTTYLSITADSEFEAEAIAEQMYFDGNATHGTVTVSTTAIPKE